MRFFSKPVPDNEAAAYLQTLPVVTRGIYDEMLPEFQHAAFFITGIRAHDALRDVLAELALARAGEDWEVLRKRIEDTVSPHLGAQARMRSLMILRAWTGRMAMVSTVRGLDARRNVFPYRKRLSTGDGRVRASHNAQHGLTLPADHPYWEEHTPPDAHNCRCLVVGVTRAQAERLAAQEEADVQAGTMLPEERRLLTGAALEALKDGRLSRGMAENYNLNKEEGRVVWHPGSVLMPIEEIRDRYKGDPAVFASFEAYAKRVKPDGQVTLWQKIEEQRAGLKRRALPPIQTELGLPAELPKARSRAEVLAAIRREPVRTGPMPVKAVKGAKGAAPAVAAAVKPAAAPAAPVAVKVAVPAGLKSPVSAGFSTVRGESLATVEKGLELINGVHDDGAGLKVTRVETPAGTSGSYHTLTGEIEVSRDGKTPLVQFLHETGHKLDFEAIRGVRLKDKEVEAAWAGVLRAVRGTKAVAAVRTLRGGKDADLAAHAAYLLRVEELWARAYAQYIAQRSGDAQALAEIKSRRDGKHGYRAESQWTDADFKPVAAAVDFLFTKLGYIKP